MVTLMTFAGYYLSFCRSTETATDFRKLPMNFHPLRMHYVYGILVVSTASGMWNRRKASKKLAIIISLSLTKLITISITKREFEENSWA